jgi:hypothetical protein
MAILSIWAKLLIMTLLRTDCTLKNTLLITVNKNICVLLHLIMLAVKSL